MIVIYDLPSLSLTQILRRSFYLLTFFSLSPSLSLCRPFQSFLLNLLSFSSNVPSCLPVSLALLCLLYLSVSLSVCLSFLCSRLLLYHICRFLFTLVFVLCSWLHIFLYISLLREQILLGFATYFLKEYRKEIREN